MYIYVQCTCIHVYRVDVYIHVHVHTCNMYGPHSRIEDPDNIEKGVKCQLELLPE